MVQLILVFKARERGYKLEAGGVGVLTKVSMLVFVKVGHDHIDAVDKSDNQFRYIYSSSLPSRNKHASKARR